MFRRKKNRNMARFGKKNGRWRGGISKTFYRRHAGCKRNDGKVVHHLDRKHKAGNRKPIRLPWNNRRVVVLNNRGNSSRAKHNKSHPEKGGVY